MFKQFVALSGHARSGSTLLASILSQNPEIYSGGSSAVCQLMWDMHQSINNSEEIKANNLTHLDEIVKQIPHSYYANTTKPIVVDRHRSWTLPANVEMLKKYVDADIKIVVLVRSNLEIVSSIVHLRKLNGWENPEWNLFVKDGEPIMRPHAGVRWAKENNNGEFLFVTYDDLINKTQSTLDHIYAHCGWAPFSHNLQFVKNVCQENDEVYGLPGLHDIRSTIKKNKIKVNLSDEAIINCIELDSMLL
jgi:sulfotransferase